MESQGSESAVGRFDLCNALQRAQRYICRIDVLLRASIFIAIAWIGVAQAQTTYVHDANGRVVAVTQSSGTTQQYTYDTLGHPSQVTAPISSGQLAILAFMPAHGLAGTAVTVEGQGFSSNAVSDAVSFNGAAAPVLSASSSQLLVSVPGGATTGPISVTVGGQTATSPQPFTVDNGVAPTITQVTPVVAIGGTVTVTGTNLAPNVIDTTAQMAGINIGSLSSVANTQLQYTVPSNAISGHVTVQTLYGTATSATPVAVLPSSVATQAATSPVTYLTANGNATPFTTSTTGQIGILTFDATQGENLELTFNGLTINGPGQNQVNVDIYSPTGSLIAIYQCTPTSPGASCRTSLWNLPAGTYAAVVSAYNGYTFSFNAILLDDTVASALTADTPVNVNLAPGGVERFTFTGTAGGAVALQLAAQSTVPSGQAIYMQIFAPGVLPAPALSGPTSNAYATFNTYAATTENLTNLPSTGTYTVIISTMWGLPASAQLTFAPGVSGSLTSGGSAQSYSTGEPGQNAYLTFTATAGANLELVLTNVSTSVGTVVSATVYNSAGVMVKSFTDVGNYQGNVGRMSLWNLPADTYSVVVSPLSGGTMSFSAAVEPDVIGPAVAPGTPVTVNLGTAEVQRLTFTANAGDTYAMQLSGVTSTPANQAMNVYIYSPTTTTITPTNYYTSFSTTNSSILNLANLPATGTYTVIVYTSGYPASGQLTMAAGVTGTLPVGGATQSYSTSLSNQNVYLSFTATAGANLELVLSNLSEVGGNSVHWTLYNSAGVEVNFNGYTNTLPGNIARFSLWNLPADTYTVVVTPNGGSTISFNAMVVPDAIGPSLTLGTPATVALTTGQVERLTFNANAGDTYVLQLSGVTPAIANQGMSAYVYSPTTTSITTSNYYTSFSSGGTTAINLPNLPASGTYTVIVNTSGFPSSGQLTLLPGSSGTLPTDGTTQSFSTSEAGQNTYLSFTATAGANVELVLSNLSEVGGNSVHWTLYNSAGTEINFNGYTNTLPANIARFALWNLAAGTYSLVITPNGGSTMSFNAAIQPDVIGPALTVGTPASFSLATGQLERLTFSANTGDNVSLQLSNISTTPANQSVTMYVFTPTTITTSNYYATTNASGSTTLNLSNVPDSGTYTVMVFTSGFPASGQLTLLSQ